MRTGASTLALEKLEPSAPEAIPTLHRKLYGALQDGGLLPLGRQELPGSSRAERRMAPPHFASRQSPSRRLTERDGCLAPEA